VLIYQVNYPQTPVLTTMLSNPYISSSAVAKGTNITGTLYYPNGSPVSTNVPVTLQYCVPAGASSGSNSCSCSPNNSCGWTTIGQAYLNGTSPGSFGGCSWSTSCTWSSSSRVPLPPSSQITFRGWWNGEPSLNLNMVLSANQTLIE